MHRVGASTAPIDEAAAREGSKGLLLRPPRDADGAALWALVRDCGVLELNTPYTYLLICAHFNETSLVAELDGRIVGAICGYRPPVRPSSIFVWQIGVHPDVRGQGLGTRMLASLSKRLVPQGVQRLEATVTPSNSASRSLFEAFARSLGSTCRLAQGFPAEFFPPRPPHEAEEGLEIDLQGHVLPDEAPEEIPP